MRRRRFALLVTLLVGAVSSGACTLLLDVRDTVEVDAIDGSKEAGAEDGLSPPIDGATLDASCNEIRAARRVGAYVTILLDSTASMVGGNRFGAAKSGILTVLQALALRKDPGVALTVFPFSGSSHPQAPYTIPVPSPFDAAALSNITSMLNAETTGNGTAVAPALLAALTRLQGFAPKAGAGVELGGARSVVLFVDNFLDSIPELTSLNAQVSAAAQSGPAPVRTFVIGLPQTPDPDALLSARLAFAGGTAPTGCNLLAKSTPFCFLAPQLPATEGDVAAVLGKVFEEILCRVDVEGWPYQPGISLLDGGPDAALVVASPPSSTGDIELTWKGATGPEVVLPDPINGWTLAREGGLRLHGKACADAVTRTDLSVRTCPR